MTSTFTGFIGVTSTPGELFYFQYFWEENTFNDFFQTYCVDKPTWSSLKCALHTARTDEAHLHRDLWLPNTFNRVLTIENLAKKIFLFMPIFISDVLTLPIRLIRLPFRKKELDEENMAPIYQLLVRNGMEDIQHIKNKKLQVIYWTKVHHYKDYHAKSSRVEGVITFDSIYSPPKDKSNLSCD